MYDVLATHMTTKMAGIEPASTIGSSSSQSVRERNPCRAMFGGMGEVKRRSHMAMLLSMSLRSFSIM